MLHADHRVRFVSHCLPVAAGLRLAGQLLTLARGALLAAALASAVAALPLEASAVGEAGGSGGPTLSLVTAGADVRPAGSSVEVDVRAANLAVPAVGMQVLVEWDSSQLTFVEATGGEGGFGLLRAATVTSVPGSAGRMQLSMVTGVLGGGTGLTDGVLGHITFTVSEGALICAPESVLEFGPSGTVVSTKLTAIGGVEIPFAGEESVVFGTDDAAPVLVGLPESVTLGPGETTSSGLVQFVAAAVTATDNCGAVAPVRVITLPGGVTVPDYPEAFPAGITTVTWTATDGSLNESSATRTVTVDPCPGPFVTYYLDSDGDGYGVDGQTQDSCVGAPAGYSATGGDCNDSSDAVYPGAPELCATVGTDNNCNGDAYESTDRSTWYADADGDGYGDPAVSVQACEAPAGYVLVAGDMCPGNGALIAPVPYFVDGDGDGFGGTSTGSFCQVTAPAGYSSTGGDCDDSNPAAFDGAPELCATVGTDNNCNGDAYDVDAGAPDKVLFFADSDGDSYTLSTGALFCAGTTNAGFRPQASSPLDCNDTNPAVNPGATEVCNSIDDDCDGAIDDADPSVSGRPTWYRDQDIDGYGDPTISTAACVKPSGYVDNSGDGCPLVQSLIAPVPYFVDGDGDGFGGTSTESFCQVTAPAGYSSTGGDCDDSNPAAFDGSPELCVTVGTDNNCNGDAYDVDAGAPDKSDFYGDSDGDGYGDPAVAVRACTAPAGFVANAGDQCPGNGALIAPVPYFVDGDGDGFGGTSTASFCQVTAPAGYSATGGDCDDSDPAVYPGAPELCATVGTDNNCNGDTYDATDTGTWFADTDGDGFGDAASSVQACQAPAGYVPVAGDCSTDNAAVNPGAAETCNGTDDNCNGLVDDGLEFRLYYLDADGDGYGDSSTGTSACAAPGPDWVTDGGDACPNDPAKLEPGDCGCGEAETDSDFDTVPDCIDNCPDAPNASQSDCDGDGVGDACSTAEDCNDNGIPDSCDIANGTSSDADSNGVPDSCQADCNGNGIPDSYDVANGALEDCNSNGVPDECEDGYIQADTGNMGPVGAEQPVEAVLTGQAQASSDVHVRVDVRGDLDGINEYLVLTLNGVSFGGDLFKAGGSECPADPDSDTLTLSMFDWMDVMERATTAGEVRVRLVASADVSASQCASASAVVSVSYFGPGNDCDQDGQPDDCQLAAGEGDCNGNGIFDACERGTITDTDSDGRPDSCERAYGDFNLDGFIDGIDLAFILGYWSETTGGVCDIDQDGDVDGNDLAYVLTRWGPVP